MKNIPAASDGDIICGIDVSYQCHGVGRTYMESEDTKVLCSAVFA